MKHSRAKCMKLNFNGYIKSKTCDIKDAYVNPSWAKITIYTHLAYQINLSGGRDVKIISHNCHIFTLGYMMKINGKESFVYVTPTKTRYIHLDEI